MRPLLRHLLVLALLPALALAASACGTDAAPTASAGRRARTILDGNPTTSIAARPVGASLVVHAGPDGAAPVVQTFGAQNALGSATTLLVTGEDGEFVQVALPTRPNGSTGWVRTADVELQSTTVAVTVDRAHHRLTVTDGGRPVVDTTAATGTPENPTPAGNFYVTDLVQTDDATGPYGPFALGISGHSETLTEFAGGDGQLAIHGTNDPSSIGNPVSHGCVRVANDVIEQLAALVPLGTPVTVV